MKKLLIIIPFLVLFACGQNYNTLHLDSHQDNTYSYSMVLEKSTYPMNHHKAPNLFINAFADELKKLQKQGGSYIEMLDSNPDTKREVEELLADESKTLKITINFRIWNEKHANSRNIESFIHMITHK